MVIAMLAVIVLGFVLALVLGLWRDSMAVAALVYVNVLLYGTGVVTWLTVP